MPVAEADGPGSRPRPPVSARCRRGKLWDPGAGRALVWLPPSHNLAGPHDPAASAGQPLDDWCRPGRRRLVRFGCTPCRRQGVGGGDLGAAGAALRRVSARCRWHRPRDVTVGAHDHLGSLDRRRPLDQVPDVCLEKRVVPTTGIPNRRAFAALPDVDSGSAANTTPVDFETLCLGSSPRSMASSCS